MLATACCVAPETGQKEATVVRELGLLSQSARAFAARTGRLPARLEEMICDAGCELGGSPDDPWRKPYRQVQFGQALFFESAGRDGLWKTADDARSAPVLLETEAAAPLPSP